MIQLRTQLFHLSKDRKRAKVEQQEASDASKVASDAMEEYNHKRSLLEKEMEEARAEKREAEGGTEKARKMRKRV